jgi:hypothetical protein
MGKVEEFFFRREEEGFTGCLIFPSLFKLIIFSPLGVFTIDHF